MQAQVNKEVFQECPKVVIVILTFNSMQWIDTCLSSVLDTDYSNYDVLMVDNGSTDGSVEYAEKNYPQLNIIKNPKNYGTAKGNNIGIKAALKQGADYVLLLNQDIKVYRGWLKILVDVAQRNKNVGLLSPIQYDYKGEDIDINFKKLLNGTSYFGDLEKGELKEMYELPRVIGASMLIHKEVFKRIGMMDEMYILYFDDTDFCRRTVHGGFSLVCVPQSRVDHHHTLVNQGKKSERVKFLFNRNHLIFELKDLDYTFWHNIKRIFFWNGLKEIVNKSEIKKTTYYRIIFNVLLRLPLICKDHFTYKKLI